MLHLCSGLQSGVSRDIFEAWCEDRRNTVILCDFAVQVRRGLRCGAVHCSGAAGSSAVPCCCMLRRLQAGAPPCDARRGVVLAAV